MSGKVMKLVERSRYHKLSAWSTAIDVQLQGLAKLCATQHRLSATWCRSAVFHRFTVLHLRLPADESTSTLAQPPPFLPAV